MKGNKKYSLSKPLENISKEKSQQYLQEHVFDSDEFKLHVKRVAFNLKISEVIVRDVLVSYFKNVFFIINTKRKIKTKINIYGYFSLFVEKGNRI